MPKYEPLLLRGGKHHTDAMIHPPAMGGPGPVYRQRFRAPCLPGDGTEVPNVTVRRAEESERLQVPRHAVADYTAESPPADSAYLDLSS